MKSLKDKNVMVVGASRGVGRVLAELALKEGAQVLAVARDPAALAREAPGLATLAADATEEGAAERALEVMTPDVLVISAGATPPTQPVHELDWPAFSRNWESDVKASFLFCREVIRRPLAPGSAVILISSGAALGGSPISGGYAGAKRTQMFLASYCQKESDRLGLGLRFVAVAPRMMPDTALGRLAAEGYAKYLGVEFEAFVASMTDSHTVEQLAEAVLSLARDGGAAVSPTLAMGAKGLAPA